MPLETQQQQRETAAAMEARQQQNARIDEDTTGGDAEDEADADDEDMYAMLPIEERSVYDRVKEMAERFAATRIGQYMIERGDRVLRVIEDTARWSLPQDKNSGAKLERPMSWLPFIYLIIVLRVIRISVSVAALMIGNGPVTPHDLVYFVQTRRRKLRSIRVQGMKTIHQRQFATSGRNKSAISNADSGNRFMAKMKRLFASAICRPGMHREPVRRVWIPRNPGVEQAPSTDEVASTSGANTTNSTSTGRTTDTHTTSNTTAADRACNKRARDDDDLTVDQLLTKYANEKSDDDEDFVPDPKELNNADDDDDDDESTSAASSVESGDEAGSQRNEAATNMVESESMNNAEPSSVSNGGSDGTSSITAPLAPFDTPTLNSISNKRNNTSEHNMMSRNNHDDDNVELVMAAHQHDHQYSSHQQQQHQDTIMIPSPILEIKKERLDDEASGTTASPHIIRENGGETWEADVVRGDNDVGATSNQIYLNGLKWDLEVTPKSEENSKSIPERMSGADLAKKKSMMTNGASFTGTAATSMEFATMELKQSPPEHFTMNSLERDTTTDSTFQKAQKSSVMQQNNRNRFKNRNRR